MVHFLSNISGDAFDPIPGRPSSSQFSRNQWASSGSSSVNVETHTHTHTLPTPTHRYTHSHMCMHAPPKAHTCTPNHTQTQVCTCTHTHTHTLRLPWNIWSHIFKKVRSSFSTFASHIIYLFGFFSQAVSVDYCLHSLPGCKSYISTSRKRQEQNTGS